jgi:hypothetical protein
MIHTFEFLSHHGTCENLIQDLCSQLIKRCWVWVFVRNAWARDSPSTAQTLSFLTRRSHSRSRGPLRSFENKPGSQTFLLVFREQTCFPHRPVKETEIIHGPATVSHDFASIPVRLTFPFIMAEFDTKCLELRTNLRHKIIYINSIRSTRILPWQILQRIFKTKNEFNPSGKLHQHAELHLRLS